MKVLITGAAGFIGSHLVKAILTRAKDLEIVGIDNLNHYYDPQLKLARLSNLDIDTSQLILGKKTLYSKDPNFKFEFQDINNAFELEKLFSSEKFDIVVNLAAQAGVRYSIENPSTYIDSNIVGFYNILECCRNYNIKHLIFASSSSVYGKNKKIPFSIKDNVGHPISLYAATKRSNELLAYTYSHLYKIPTTGLRFFTVYGPWGRPDMAYYMFTKAILEGKKIRLFNRGKLSRDFTYIDDIIEVLVRIIQQDFKVPSGENTSDSYRLYNIGNNQPESLEDFVTILESILGKEADKELVEMQPGDVYTTYADISETIRDFGYAPQTKLKEGLEAFVKWYLNFYNQNNK